MQIFKRVSYEYMTQKYSPQSQYTAKHKPNQLLYGTGQIAVITGWTVKEAIAKHLDPSEYGVIGQLYSPTRGINFLIRNLLLNPHIRRLVIVNATREDKNAGASQCLIDFLENGVEIVSGKYWKIASPVVGYIDSEVEILTLQRLRRSLVFTEAKTVNEAVNAVKDYAQQDPLEPWGEPIEFPLAEVVPDILPGVRYGHRIEGKTIAEAWVKIIHRIKTTGTIRGTSHDAKWQELIDLTAIVTDEPEEFYFPEPNYLPIDREFLENYISQILDDAPNREGVKYTYGQRLRSWFGTDQIEQVIQELIGEIDAASAVMNLWDVKDHEKGGSPCLNHIWIRVVENEISLTATFRSNDMFSAWPANAMGLRALQKHIQEQINQRSEHDLKMGPLITISQSAHIYEDTWENADQLIKKQYNNIWKTAKHDDPSGNFLIEILPDDREITIIHTFPSGEIAGVYTDKNPLKLVRKICAALPGIQPAHASYLGIEVQRASNCLGSGVEYVQDRQDTSQRSHLNCV